MATQSLPIAEGLRDALSQLTFRHLLQMYKNGIWKVSNKYMTLKVTKGHCTPKGGENQYTH